MQERVVSSIYLSWTCYKSVYRPPSFLMKTSCSFFLVQIFGRAGRPGYETSGVGYICTTQDKLDHYLDAVLSQHPIESR